MDAALESVVEDGGLPFPRQDLGLQAGRVEALVLGAAIFLAKNNKLMYGIGYWQQSKWVE